MSVGLNAGPAAPAPSGLARTLEIFVWLLPFHIAAMALLFGYIGVPGPTMRVVAAWKELLVVALAVLAVGRAVAGRGPRATVHLLDLAVAGLLFYAVWFLVGAGSWYGQDEVPLVARLYGLRDLGLFLLLYFVGRATPSVVESDRILRLLVTVGVITSVIAVLEWLLVSPTTLVVLGAARYFREFLGVALATTSNDYGLPDNYWTIIGDRLVRRAGSTYLSSQGFALPFLVILPAATLWVTDARRRLQVLAWGAYAFLWIALLLTVTRMTIVACLLQTVLIAGLRRRWSLAVNLGTAALTAFVIAAALFPGVVIFAWNTLTWQTGSSASHLEDWRDGLVNTIEHPLGAGLGTADQVALRFGVTPLAYDNQYLTYAVELGIPGLALLLAVLIGGLAAGIRALRGAEPLRTYGLLVSVTALGIVWNALTAAVFNSMLLSYVFFWLVGAVVTAGDEA